MRGDEFRADIQGLRALAVLAVVLFHLWPNAVPGGFVGVDVFFVISGYLITGLLFRELHQTGHISLLRFYARRAKRLLPAASLVLIVVAIATPLLLPPSRWDETSIGIIASALNLENWHLAWLSVDYLGAEDAPSPVQHYWSLSIEEQFYLIWPLLMIAAGALSARMAGLRPRIIAPLVVIVLGSFIASVWLTQTDEDAAYFVTHTRLWELGLGALLAVAVLPRPSPRAQEAMRAGGLVMIFASIFAFSGHTPFPGYAALLPTLGCGLVLAAGNDAGRWSAHGILASRPAQYLGDISYSIYLWHWPLIIFAGFFAIGGIHAAWGLALLALTIGLAGATKHFVEDPVRYWRLDTRSALGFGALLIAGSVLSATVIYKYVGMQVVRSYEASPDYPGAAAFLAGAPVPKVDGTIPPLALLKKDKAPVYGACHLSKEDADLDPCLFGARTGPRVLVIGDSHAANWIPALIDIADEEGWRLETHTKSSCPFLLEAVDDDGEPYAECLQWGRNLLASMRKTPPDLVIMAMFRARRMAAPGNLPEHEQTGQAVADVWRALRAMGLQVVGMRSTPILQARPEDCLQHDPGCAADESAVHSSGDPMQVAHRLVPEVPLVDMSDAFCRDGKCPMIIGNVVVWRDPHHLTGSYAQSMAATLKQRIATAVGDTDGKVDLNYTASVP